MSLKEIIGKLDVESARAASCSRQQKSTYGSTHIGKLKTNGTGNIFGSSYKPSTIYHEDGFNTS